MDKEYCTVCKKFTTPVINKVMEGNQINPPEFQAHCPECNNTEPFDDNATPCDFCEENPTALNQDYCVACIDILEVA